MSEQDDGDIFEELAALSGTFESIERRANEIGLNAPDQTDSDEIILNRVRHYYIGRRKRDNLFRLSGLVGEPAWDILIILFIVAEEGRKSDFPNLCKAIALPPATALRWVSFLEANGLVELSSMTPNASSADIALTEEAKQKLKSYFEQLCR